MSRVDTHHHFVPAKFRQYADKLGEWPSPEWSIESDQKFCHEMGIKFAFLSITTPGPGVGGSSEIAADIAWDSNVAAAEYQQQHPDKYGFFACLPPPTNMKAALNEIANAYDTLHADGITLLTSYEGKYLGHQDFEPMWAELNARNAVVLIHPTSPHNWKPFNSQMLAPFADFAWETTRCGLDLILSDTLNQAPNCRIILSHAGGCLPWIWHRPVVLMQSFPGTKKTVEQIREEARRFYYDTALSGNPDVMNLLMSFARKERILFGSDYPYANMDNIKVFTGELDAVEMSAEMRERITWRNAVELFPRLKKLFAEEGA